MVEDFRQDGTVNWESEWLKFLVKNPTSWSAQSFSTHLQMPSHLMLLYSEDGVAVGCWLWCGCLWWLNLKMGREVVQLLCE